MNGTQIKLYDIFGSTMITLKTPIIILRNVSPEYLSIPEFKNNDGIIMDDIGIYNINIDKLHNDIGHYYTFIDRFTPIGQVYSNDDIDGRLFTVIMANTYIFNLATQYKEISRNIWIGYYSKSDVNSRTISCIYSIGSPQIKYPVFPSSYLKQADEEDTNKIYNDLFISKYCGKWVFDTLKFNMDKSRLVMIDSAGGISNMYIPKPITPKDVIDIGYGDDSYDRKVYFTAQGSIVGDSNCVPPLNNMNKMNINECNATSESGRTYGMGKVGMNKGNTSDQDDYNEYSINAHDDDQLSLGMNDIVISPNDNNTQLKRGKTFSKGKNLVLREKDEPWFRNREIVGDAANTAHPYKVSASLESLNNIDNDIQNNALNSGGCNTQYGYSRYEQAANCHALNGLVDNGMENTNENINENFDGTNGNTTGNTKSVSQKHNMDYTNSMIMVSIIIIIIILLLYRKS